MGSGRYCTDTKLDRSFGGIRVNYGKYILNKFKADLNWGWRSIGYLGSNNQYKPGNFA